MKGSKFGRLTLIDQVGINRHKRPVWSCQCECGRVTPTDILFPRGLI